MIAIVDYGVGNLYSLQSSLRHIRVDCVVTDQKQILDAAHGVILPGVGAFGDAIGKLRKNGLDQIVSRQVQSGKPLLGICLGMQLLYETSAEYGLHTGLGLIPGQVVGLADHLGSKPLTVPHMGWNDLHFNRPSPLLKYSRPGEFVYYVHSFFAPLSAETVASSAYGPVRITGAVQCGNVFGTQFHPEKSGEAGLRMLRAFAELCA